VDLSDAVFVLAYLFRGGQEPRCLEAADIDDDGEVVITDAVYFQGNGKVYTYDFSVKKLDEYSVGRGPRDFVFKNEK